MTFASQNEGNSIEVRFEDNTLWLTQQLIAELFQTSVPNISMHIKSIYEDKELEAEATFKNLLTVRQEGSRQVNRNLEYYNLDMIIAVPQYKYHPLRRFLVLPSGAYSAIS